VIKTRAPVMTGMLRFGHYGFMPNRLRYRDGEQQPEGKLAVGEPRLERVTRQVEGRGFADAARPEDWVSLHWGRACEVLTDRQVANLERCTRYRLAIAKRTS
jgi:hypothetical protein